MGFEVFALFKEFTSFILLRRSSIPYFNYSLTFFINNITVENALSLAKNFIIKEPLLLTKRNGYLSGLVFMVYLKVEEGLSAEEEERMLIQSMASM